MWALKRILTHAISLKLTKMDFMTSYVVAT